MRPRKQLITLTQFAVLVAFAMLCILPRAAACDPIHDAANSGDVATVKRLLAEDHTRINARTPGGATPLLGAAIRGQEAVVRLLIENDADVDMPQGDGWTPLHAAVCDGNDAAHVAITRLLLDHHAEIDAKRQDGWTPLHAAALKGNTNTMAVLLERDAALNPRDNSGATPLYLAAENGQLESIKLLIAKGADPYVKNNGGKTPMVAALDKGNMPAVICLLAHVKVTAHIINASLGRVIQELLAAAKVEYRVHSSNEETMEVTFDDASLPNALRLVETRQRMHLMYRNVQGMLEVSAVKVTQAGEDPRYRFLRTISRQTLNNYLSRAVTDYGLCSTSPEPATDTFDDDIRMLVRLGAKFIGRAAYSWVPPDDDEAHYRMAKERADAVHAIDPDMILQAAVFEAVYESVGRIPVPDWVFTEFRLPVEKRCFRYEAMLYPGGKFRNHWTQGASIPDMSQLETRMYFYYRARRYIDSGFEAIHFGQIALMDHRDEGHRAWLDMLTRVRRYAAVNARRQMVLCDAHTHGVTVDGRLLFDFHTWPLMARDVRGAPQKVELVAGYYNSIYGLSAGGITPSGWACDSLPYMCELDCGGSSDKPGQASNFPWNWGYDCGTWFAHQDDAYRAQYLKYAHDWLIARNEDAHMQMPARLNLAITVEGVKMWQANTRTDACPHGFNEENAIKSIWDSESAARR